VVEERTMISATSGSDSRRDFSSIWRTKLAIVYGEVRNVQLISDIPPCESPRGRRLSRWQPL
jgi:hypothetical protein